MSFASSRASSGVKVPTRPRVKRRFGVLLPPAPGRYSTIHVFTPDGITFRPKPFRFVSYQKVRLAAGWMESMERFVILTVGISGSRLSTVWQPPGSHRKDNNGILQASQGNRTKWNQRKMMPPGKAG